jgi:Holliday junction resolvase
MTNYEKGRRFEYRVRDVFKRHGFVVIRAAQSKPIDLVCLKDGKSILVECKVNKSSLGRNGRKELLSMAKTSKAVPVLAYREKRKVKLLNVETSSQFSLSWSRAKREDGLSDCL